MNTERRMNPITLAVMAGVFWLTIAVAAFTASDAKAQQTQMVPVPCGPAPVFLHEATVNREETSLMRLGAENDWEVYIFVNPDTGTWSVIATNGTHACAVAAGKNGVDLTGKPAPKGDPS